MENKILLTTTTRQTLQTETFFFQRRTEVQEHLRERLQQCFLIYDVRFQKDSLVRSFPHRIAVRSGEDLKSLAQFSKLMPFVHKRMSHVAKSQLTFVALGGGSVGDFAGFVASVYKRGCPWIQIPTTWLAAIDSSHGGKTALNLQNKNQIGTIHYPKEVLIAQEYLNAQGADLMFSALGELIKSAFLDQRLFSKMKQFQINPHDFYQMLPFCIQVKNSFLKKDPFEITGERFYLNLGHTVGHGIETTFGIPHGLAVLFGMEFMLRWSVHRGSLSAKRLKNLVPAILREQIQIAAHRKKLSYAQIIANKTIMLPAMSDKKRDQNDMIQEIFIADARCVLDRVHVHSYEHERMRQWKEKDHGSILF